MLLLIHIAIALLSIAIGSLTYMRPAKRHFRAAYLLTGSTLVTGAALVLTEPAHMGTACISGLLYLAMVSFIIGAAHLKTAMR